MRLVEGAEAIRANLPVNSTVVVEVPLGAGSDEGTSIHRVSSLIAVRDAQALALGQTSGLAITIGGDCAVELASIDYANAKNAGMAVVWLDAHPDLNTAETSPSHAFHGMIVRTLLGDGIESLVPAVPLTTDKLVLAGTRALDDAEQQFVDEKGIRMLPPRALTVASITEALAATGATCVYIHVDLDVLDPAEFGAFGYPEPFGVPLADLLEIITAIKAALPLVGAGVTEFAPASPDAAADDLGSILRIIGALAK